MRDTSEFASIFGQYFSHKEAKKLTFTGRRGGMNLTGTSLRWTLSL